MPVSSAYGSEQDLDEAAHDVLYRNEEEYQRRMKPQELRQIVWNEGKPLNDNHRRQLDAAFDELEVRR